MKKLFLVLMVSFILGGCASTSQIYRPRAYDTYLVPGLLDQAYSTARTQFSGRAAQEVQKAISGAFR